jgi:hypothetical protein
VHFPRTIGEAAKDFIRLALGETTSSEELLKHRWIAG